jgi:hypothetical protein
MVLDPILKCLDDPEGMNNSDLLVGAVPEFMSVIPDFASKTKYSSYICPGSIVPHIRTKSVHR